jgi:hypothetical protein
MDPQLLADLDPSGSEAMALCAVAAAALAAFIGGGFALLRRAGRADRLLAAPARRGARELGVTALWRLNRAVRRGPKHAPTESLSKTGEPHPSTVTVGRRQ